MTRKNVDLIITIGGDGTLLSNLRTLKSSIPIVGVNMGTVGFLADINPKNAIQKIQGLINGFKYEKRERLSLYINNNFKCNSFNEVVLTCIEHSKILSYELFINDLFIKTIRADGIVFSTSTGSTAYALSNGGSLIHPEIQVIEIVPIAPFTLITRPIIIPIESKISIKIKEKNEKIIFISDGSKLLDSKKQMLLARFDDDIVIKKSKCFVNIVKVSDSCYYHKINHKLNFNKDKLEN